MASTQDRLLFSAISNNSVEQVSQAINQGANVNIIYCPSYNPLTSQSVSKQSETYTPIFRAVELSCIDIVQLLIQHSADVNLGSNSGLTPLHCASKRGFLEIAKLLIENYADVNASDAKNITPLYNACMRNNIRMAQLLIENGADVNIGDTQDVTSLHIAAVKDFVHIARLLVENRADVNISDVQKMTPLHNASERGFVEIVRLLVENGADLNAKSSSNQTPWNLACSKGQANKLSEIFRAGRRRQQTLAQASAPDLQTIQETETSTSGPSQLLRSLHTSSTRRECTICTENESDHAIIPCGHVFCLRCINRIQQKSFNCPNCQRPIENNLKLFF